MSPTAGTKKASTKGAGMSIKACHTGANIEYGNAIARSMTKWKWFMFYSPFKCALFENAATTLSAVGAFERTECMPPEKKGRPFK